MFSQARLGYLPLTLSFALLPRLRLSLPRYPLPYLCRRPRPCQYLRHRYRGLWGYRRPPHSRDHVHTHRRLLYQGLLGASIILEAIESGAYDEDSEEVQITLALSSWHGAGKQAFFDEYCGAFGEPPRSMPTDGDSTGALD